MKKLYTRKRKRFTYPELSLYILAAVAIFWIFGLGYLLFYLGILICVVSIMSITNARRREEMKLLRELKTVSDRRLLMIRKLVDLSYTYESDSSLFFKKFREAVNIEFIRRENIIEVNPQTLHKRIEASAGTNVPALLTKEDIELCCLMDQGFTPRELSVIYNMKNPQSIYIKRHRLKAKLQSLHN